jgi:hypothetical protein
MAMRTPSGGPPETESEFYSVKMIGVPLMSALCSGSDFVNSGNITVAHNELDAVLVSSRGGIIRDGY